jgi:hypothetical protein
MRVSRPAPTRLTPPSYFCTCWNVTPSRFGELRLRHAFGVAMDADVVADQPNDVGGITATAFGTKLS